MFNSLMATSRETCAFLGFCLKKILCAAKKKVVVGGAGRGLTLLARFVTKCVGHSGTMPSGGGGFGVQTHVNKSGFFSFPVHSVRVNPYSIPNF